GRSVEPQPLPVSSEPAADLIVVGAGRKELLRLERATGRLRWRSVLPGPALAPPVLGRRHVLVLSELPAGRSRLEWIDLESGAAQLAVDLPQKVEVAPAVDLRRERIYLAAEHSYLWILSLQDGQCLEVVSLDQEPGSIAAPPLPLADWVLVAENHRLDRTLLKLIAVGQPGQTPSQIIFQEELPGHVDTAPVAADRRVAVLTDRGAIRVYEIQTAGGKTPLAQAAERGPEGPANMIRFPLLVGQELWIAGHELTRFAVQTAQGRLEFRPPEDPETGDIFLLPPLALEKVVVHVRCRPGVPGVWAAAVDRQTGKRQWQTHLAVPPAGEPILPADSPGKLWVITQTGEVFAIELAGKKGRHAADPPIASFQRLPSAGLSGATASAAAANSSAGREQPQEIRGSFLAAPDGMLLFTLGLPADRWSVLEKKDGAIGWTGVSAPTPLVQPPTPFADGVLVPTGTGRIELRDARTGKELMGPFQPPLEPGRMPAWGQPTVIPPSAASPAPEKTDAEKVPAGGKPAFLVSDGLGRVYRVGVQEQPKPHLKALASVDLPGRPSGPIAVAGQTAWLVEEPARSEHPPSAAVSTPVLPSAKTDQGKPSAPSESPKTGPEGSVGRLVCLSLPKLERKESARLEGRCVWGPARIGEFILLAADSGQYLLADGQGNLLADLRTDADPPAGAPFSWQGGILVATRKGRLLWLRPEANTWKADKLLQIDRPLAAGPVAVQNQLVLLGHDGTVYALKLPEVSVEKSPPSSSPPPPDDKKPPQPSPEPASETQKPPSKPDAQEPLPAPNHEASPKEPAR
ncbi:MAG TPA: PQQ-binding-like beta-propeller repeat protein, partial [Thermoguttaceae bacterium]|nr:PQQ-binding-like beta-propeller repeat protein [Thermoguttaceae bacterium]